MDFPRFLCYVLDLPLLKNLSVFSLFLFSFSLMCLLIYHHSIFKFFIAIFMEDKSNKCFCDFCKRSRGIRPDVSLVPPIRQTASIFKQPVTVHRNHDSKVKTDLKHGTSQEKPKQLFWEKRLEVKLLQISQFSFKLRKNMEFF